MSSSGGKREQIIEGAVKVFGEYGLRKTTVEDIVREAGVARATVYKYFDTKEEIFDAVFEREAEQMIAAIEEAVDGEATTRDKLRAATVTNIGMIQRKLKVLRAVVEAAVLGKKHPGCAAGQLQARAVGVYERILSEGRKKGEVDVDDTQATARVVILMFKGLFVATLAGAMGEETDATVEAMLDVIMSGLRPRGEQA